MYYARFITLQALVMYIDLLMPFRLQNIKYLLTWPQARDLNKDLIYQHLEAIEEIEYCVICCELHEDGNEHYHAVVIFKKKLNLRRNVFTIEENVCNVQPIKNTKRDLRDAIAYVKKEHDWKDWGDAPQLDQKLNRKEKIDFIKENTEEDCIESGLFSFSEIAKIAYIKSKLKKPREERERIVYWFFGETGSGKTREAWKIAKENYTMDEICVLTGNQREFKNGYTGQRCVIFDDFRNGDVRFNELLTLCDRYPVNVNVKGSYCPWLADMIIFTSPLCPEETFVKVNKYTGDSIPREDIAQFTRRCNVLRQFP